MSETTVNPKRVSDEAAARPIFHDTEADLAYRAKWWTSRALIYAALIAWTVICLAPIFWTITTSFKTAPDVLQGHVIPFLDFKPDWLGWRSLGLSPDTIGSASTVRDEFVKRFSTSTIASLSSSTLAVVLGTLAGYGLSRFNYKFLWMRNQEISFFFLSQLILPPVVLALPFLVLYKQLALIDTLVGLVLLYALTVLPIVIWIMRDQFGGIPTELEEAALVDGESMWGAFRKIILPLAVPGIAAAFILCLVLTWNEYFFASLLTSTNTSTLPVMVASQTGSQGISWWSMAALSFAAILPLIVVAIFMERWIVKGIVAGAVK
jgi:multiple sugar transport system permease protein